LIIGQEHHGISRKALVRTENFIKIINNGILEVFVGQYFVLLFKRSLFIAYFYERIECSWPKK